MFKFGFGEENEQVATQAATETAVSVKQSLDVLKSDAPRISYTRYSVGGTELPRRDFFDVKFQLMQQESLNEEEEILLGNEDVRKTVYEGGLKIWEGTWDLIEQLKNYEGGHSVLELGSGAGIPSVYLLYKAIKSGSKGRFILADYNLSVLRLVTMPNVVLAWLAGTDQLEATKGEINLTEELIDQCQADLKAKGIDVEFISGGWSPKFSELVGSSVDLVLASETVYSVDSLVAFTDVLANALGSASTALVAAKRIYFGVGGGIVEFERILDEKSLQHSTVHENGNVGRVVIKVTKQ